MSCRKAASFWPEARVSSLLSSEEDCWWPSSFGSPAGGTAAGVESAHAAEIDIDDMDSRRAPSRGWEDCWRGGEDCWRGGTPLEVGRTAGEVGRTAGEVGRTAGEVGRTASAAMPLAGIPRAGHRYSEEPVALAPFVERRCSPYSIE